MLIDGYSIAVDHLAKFFHGLHCFGWFHHPSDVLKSVKCEDPHLRDFISEVDTPHGGVASLGPRKGFRIEIFRKANDSLDGVNLVFSTKRGKVIRVPAWDLAKERLMAFYTSDRALRFPKLLKDQNARTMLDIGGRDRSGVDRSKIFPGIEVTVLDIVAGQNVDVVGDAHQLSRYFEPNSFDAVFSVSVFEHLLMPWQAAVEINTILKPGGIGFVQSHQTLGMHDIPWDFYRFSDVSWDGIFNRDTGFEIIDRFLDLPMFVIPMFFRPEMLHAEKSAGYECSAVLFRKTGSARVEWRASHEELVTTVYPG